MKQIKITASTVLKRPGDHRQSGEIPPRERCPVNAGTVFNILAVAPEGPYTRFTLAYATLGGFNTWLAWTPHTDIPAPDNEISATAIDLLHEFEGFSTSAYPDPLTGSAPWTIGYGFTYWPDTGEPVQPNQTVSRDKADELLKLAISKDFLPRLRQIPGWEDMSANQRGVLLSFAWNLGADFYGAPGFGTITRVLRDQHHLIPSTLELYRNPGSKVEAGLLRRRRAEGRLWSS